MQRRYPIAAGMPSFANPEVEILYSTGLEISNATLDKIMSLPRRTLVDDLEKVLQDSITRFDLFIEADSKEILTEQDVTFPMHALMILAELRSSKSLSVVLSLFRMNEEFIDFWFGEYVNMFLWEPIYQLGYSQLKTLKSFVCENDILPTVRYAVSTAVAQISYHQPEKYLDVVIWYRDVLNFMIKNRENDRICNSDVLGFLVLDATNIGAQELSSEIKQILKYEMANEWICGNYEKIMSKISEGADVSEELEIKDIFHQYEEIIDFFTRASSESEEEDELFRFSRN